MTVTGEAAPDRRVTSLSGADALEFLQGLVTNDVLRLGKSPGLVWTALLSPQGKYLADFFVARTGGGLFLDMPEMLADKTLQRLAMYRLRADVALTPAPLHVHRGLGAAPPDALSDPRHPALGWRAYRPEPGAAPQIDWDAIRVRLGVPEAGIELIPDDSYILEMGFDRLNGVDFRKGCYVGQEVTARMKHKTELKKGLARVCLLGDVPAGTPVEAEGKPAGTVYTSSAGKALAWLRFDRAEGTMTAGDATLRMETDFSQEKSFP
jgi:tRNA-modifying protein YgfZ